MSAMSIEPLAKQVVELSLDLEPRQENRPSHVPRASTSSTAPSHTRHSRAESSSSVNSRRVSEASSPNRPLRSPLRANRAMSSLLGSEASSLVFDIDELQRQVSALVDKIYELEELRHSPSARSTNGAGLDLLLSEVNEAIDALSPSMAAVVAGNVSPEMSDRLGPLQADWSKVIAQHTLLKQELQEDPWLIRFRTTAEQAEGMMDPLQTSLQDVTNYVGRILSSFTPVPMHAPEGKLSIDSLRSLAAGHGRMKSTYVPSVNKILKMMDRSVSDRALKNGEALRRLGDMAQRWGTLQKQLAQLDAKVALVLSQNDPDHPQFEEHVEMLDDDNYSLSPKMSPVPKLDLPYNSMPQMGPPLSRVFSSSSTASGASNGFGLAPPSMQRGSGSATPNASRTIRRAQSRPSLPASMSADRPRWNLSTKPARRSPSPPPTPTLSRRPSHGGFGTPANIRRVMSPTLSSPPGSVSRIPQKTPRKSVPSTPSNPRPSGRPSFSGMPPSSFRAGTPASTPSRNTPGRNTPSLTRPPTRPSSRMSHGSVGGSIQLASQGVKPFEPSKYDLLDQEVQKVLDTVKPNIFVARIDAPLRRGQRKPDGEQWTGEFLFGAGERSSSVKLVELAGRGMLGGKRVKCMVRIGGAWLDLTSHLTRKKAEMLDDDF